MYWNANSVNNKIVELYEFLNQQHIQLSCISETFLNPNQHLLSHPDYNIYRFDRTQNSRGGVAIIVNKSLNHQLLPNVNLKIIECISVEVKLMNHSKTIFHSVYLPGSASSTMIRQHFINDLRKLIRFSGNTSYFICGDFNTKHRHWNCNRANLAGTLLYEEYINSNFQILHPDEPTYIPEDNRRTPSTIDLIITNALHQTTDLYLSLIHI